MTILSLVEAKKYLFAAQAISLKYEGLLCGQGFAADASLIVADVQKQNSSNPEDWEERAVSPEDAPRAVREYLDALDDAAFGAASKTKLKFTAHADPASQWTAARKGRAMSRHWSERQWANAFFAYSDNYLIDTDHGIIMDLDASRSIRQAEVGAMRKMIDRTEERFGLKPDWVAADTAYGSADNLVWLALKRKSSRSSRPLITQNEAMEPGHDLTLPGMRKTTDTSARKAKSCGTRAETTQIRPKCAGLESEELRHAQIRLPGLPVKSKMLPQLKLAPDPPREIRNRSRFCAAMRGLRIQSDVTEAAQEGGDALRTSQTHPRARQAPNTGALRRPGRIYSHSYRPEPPETGQTEAGDACRWVEKQRRHRLLQEIRSIGPDVPPKTTGFSTTSALTRLLPHDWPTTVKWVTWIR